MRKIMFGLCALAILAGGCSKGTEATKQSESSAAPSAKSSSAPGASSSGKKGSKSSTAPSATTKALPSPAPAKGTVPANAAPPKTGTYTYKITVNGKSSMRRTTISNESSSPTQTKQTEKASTDKASSTQHVIWTKTAKVLADTESTQGSNHFDCNWNPDMIEYEFPMHAGLHWTQTTTCSVNYQGVKVVSTVRNDATVKSNGEVTLGGRTLKVWVLEIDITNTTSYGAQKSSGTIKRMTQFSPEIGLAVRYTETGQGQGGQVTATFELQNASPS